MPDDSSRGGWLRGLAGGSGKKSGEKDPRIGKPLSVAVAEKPPAAAQSQPNRGSRGLAFKPGQLFFHFRLQQQLGRGATATVYRAVDERTNAVVALKLLSLADDWPDDLLDEAKLRLLREAEAAGSLTHPDIVEIREAGEHEGQVYMAMEYVEGVNLATHATEGRMLPPRLVCEMCARVADAVYFAHQRGIIHRDIKPANIILCQHGGACDVAKVVDFGLVKDLKNDVSNDGVVGTPSYTAPETVTDPKAVTSSVDLYALGAVGYYLLSGRRVFEGTSALDLCVQHVTKEPKPLSQVAPEVVPELEQIIMRCLRKPPHERFETVAALAEALRAVRVNDWSEEDAASWWSRKRHEAALSNPSLPTQTLTIDMTRRL
jgi:serine/threonine-protein kinase